MRDHRILRDRLALVTGGARGIGRGIAAELLRAEARVVIADLRESDMEIACKDLGRLGAAGSVRMDVSDPASIQAAYEEVRRDHGPIDVLVNNAGVGKPGLFAEEPPESIPKTMAVDLIGAMLLARLVLPDMIARRFGRIANMSSMMGVSGSPGFVTYSTAKFGLVGLSEALQRELRRYQDIAVTVILPPSVKTAAFAEARASQPALMRWRWVPPISIERVASRTVKGIAKGRRRVYCSPQSLLAALSERFAPWLMDLVLLRMFRPST